MMSKKDYVKIAALLKHRKPVQNPDRLGDYLPAFQVWHGVAWDLADVFAIDNPRFDRARFFTAADIPGHREVA